MSIGHVIVGGVYVALTALPLIFRTNRNTRIVCVVLLLIVALALLHAGLMAAARNIGPLSPELTEQTVKYWDAWQHGRTDTQKMVNSYVLPLAMLYASLALLAIVPARPKPKEEGVVPLGKS